MFHGHFIRFPRFFIFLLQYIYHLEACLFLGCMDFGPQQLRTLFAPHLEIQVTTAQSALEQANAARLAAEEQLASAKTVLETATAAEQAALAANAEQLQVAEQAQTAAKQQLAIAQTTLDSANTKLQELEQQIADARTTVADANEAKRIAEQALAKAVNEVRGIKGEPALPVVEGTYNSPPGS
jgi:outer membrane protein TolC